MSRDETRFVRSYGAFTVCVVPLVTLLCHLKWKQMKYLQLQDCFLASVWPLPALFPTHQIVANSVVIKRIRMPVNKLLLGLGIYDTKWFLKAWNRKIKRKALYKGNTQIRPCYPFQHTTHITPKSAWPIITNVCTQHKELNCQWVKEFTNTFTVQRTLTQTLYEVKPLNTKRRLFYLKTQFEPRSKHFSSRL